MLYCHWEINHLIQQAASQKRKKVCDVFTWTVHFVDVSGSCSVFYKGKEGNFIKVQRIAINLA
jgi:hypothetical protein